MNKVFACAKKWVFEIGFPVLPIVYQSKRAMVEWEYYQTHLPTDTELQNWFYSPMRNLGVVVGNGLVVIDFDVQEVFDYWHTEFQAKYPQGTFMVKTRRGVHVYITTKEQAKNHHNELLDVKAERGYVLAPPSIHPSGFVYSVLSDKPILSVGGLDDVLPDYYLPEPQAHTEYENKYLPRHYYNDPFDEADNAQEYNLQEIKNRHSILDYLKGVKQSDRGGRWFVAFCPFHDDRNQSLWIDMQNQVCGCHKCNMKTLDVINLYAKLHKISNSDAIRILSEKF